MDDWYYKSLTSAEAHRPNVLTSINHQSPKAEKKMYYYICVVYHVSHAKI